MAEIISTMVQVHVASIRNGNWKHLALRRSAEEKVFPLQWQAITGRIEAGETAIQTAIREVREECGIQEFQSQWTLPYVSIFYHSKRDAIIAVPCFGFALHPETDIYISSEHDFSEWLPINELLNRLVIPAQKKAAELFDEILHSKSDDALFSDVYQI